MFPEKAKSLQINSGLSGLIIVVKRRSVKYKNPGLE
jgi:hypothetical protein